MPVPDLLQRANQKVGLQDAALKQEINQSVVQMARLLDDAIRIPGTQFRVGLDGLVGLVPILGDVITVAFGYLMIREAVRLKVPRAQLAQMIGYYAIDVLGGLVPVVGDVFDFAFKANSLSLKVLQSHLEKVKQARPQTPA